MSPLRRLYDWTLRQAEHQHARWVLLSVSFAEASFFPLPPDILLLPMVLARRAMAFSLAGICTVGSVIGGLLGYAIGALLMDTVGQWVMQTYHLEKAFQTFHEQFNHYGVWVILAKGLTPIPFKLVTIASGAAHFDLGLFVLSAALTRGARFYLVAWLGKAFGDPIKIFVERYLNWVALGVLALIIIGFVVVLR